MKNTTRLLAALLLVTAAGCQPRRGTEAQPRSYDALALETGHWEWESTAYRGGKRTPATEGYSRQLVFQSEGRVLIHHSGRLNKTRPYTLSMGTLARCTTSPTQVPVITYETDSDVPNNDRKTYSLTSSPTSQTLVLVGELACTDAGATETYHWVAE